MKAILTYHSIDDSGSVISTDATTLRRHVRWLATAAVRTCPTIDELVRLPANADAVALTFDDGFRNVATVAAPMLHDAGLVATVFVVTDAVATTNRWRGTGDPGVPELGLMDWSALGKLAERGFTIGVHTRTHPRLAALADAEAEDELLGAAARIREELGVDAAVVAYPYGSCGAAAERIVATHFAYGCTTELRTLDAVERPERLPRLDAYYFRRAGTLEAWGTLPFAARLRFRAGARRLRHSLAAAGGR